MGFSIQGEAMLVLGVPICLIVLIISILKKRKHKIKINWLREMVKFAFGVYVLKLIGVTLLPIEIGFMYRSEYFRLPVNLIPFKDVFRQIGTVGTAYGGDVAFHIKLILRNVLGNFILLLPLGVMSPVIWDKFTRIKNVIILGFVISIGIEVLQLLEIVSEIAFLRVVDVDDVILNVSGVLLGYLIYKGIFHLSNKFDIKFMLNMFSKDAENQQLAEDN